jgi:hypothetical protein
MLMPRFCIGCALSVPVSRRGYNKKGPGIGPFRCA